MHPSSKSASFLPCRYASQTGYHVPRRFGWDCHGLPVEQETEKMLGGWCSCVRARARVCTCVCACACALCMRKHPGCPGLLTKYTVLWLMTSWVRILVYVLHVCCKALAQLSCIRCVAGLRGRADILALGIDKFNEECRSIVMR